MDSAIVATNKEAMGSFLATWEQRKEIAQTLISSGFLPNVYQKPEQVLAVMLTAHELNIPTMEGLRSINVIQQKPTISPQLMLALARRTKELEDIHFDRTPTGVTCVVKRKGQSPVSTSFGVPEATALGLMGKDNYKKQAGVMFQWRALAANLRVTFGDAIAGLYTPEELGAEVAVTEEGEQVLVHAEPPKIEEAKVEEAEPEKPDYDKIPEQTPVPFGAKMTALAKKGQVLRVVDLTTAELQKAIQYAAEKPQYAEWVVYATKAYETRKAPPKDWAFPENKQEAK